MKNILTVKNLHIQLETEQQLKIVNGVDIRLHQGSVLGIVGESGCGKSVTCLSLLGLLPPAFQVVSGEIWLAGVNLLKCGAEERRRMRGKKIAMIMQNPIAAFNPTVTIGQHFVETLQAHTALSEKTAQDLAVEVLDSMNLPHCRDLLIQYPFQLSGGMLQRVMIAIAIAAKPSVLVADEPTTALDATVQYQILAQLAKMQERYQTAMLLVTHDLSVIAQMAQEVAVMYCGYLVEKAPVMELFDRPLHPYTEALLESRPSLAGKRLQPIGGHLPLLVGLNGGCPFLPRCKRRLPGCNEYHMKPVMAAPDHLVRCAQYC